MVPNVSAVSFKSVCGYLEKVNWAYKAKEDEGLILTGFHCNVPFYSFVVPIEIRVAVHWISIRSFLQRRVSKKERLAVLGLFSKLNAQCRLARFFLVEDCALLQIDVKRKGCHIGVFLEGLRVACEYSSYYGVEVAVLSTSPSLAELFDNLEAEMMPSQTTLSIMDDDPLLEFDISANRLAGESLALLHE